MEFDTSSDSEAFDIDARLNCDNIASQEDVIQCLPFLISRFGVQDSVLKEIQKKANQFGQLTNSRNTFTIALCMNYTRQFPENVVLIKSYFSSAGPECYSNSQMTSKLLPIRTNKT